MLYTVLQEIANSTNGVLMKRGIWMIKKIITKYLDKRCKGKIDNEIFHLHLDLSAEKREYYKSQTSFFTKLIHRLKTKQDVVDWHVRKIKKYASNKYLVLNEEQKQFIDKICEYENKEYDYELIDLIKERHQIIKVPLGYSLRSWGLCLYEWAIILIVVLLAFVINALVKGYY